MSVLYFKQLFPNSHIVAFEPDPILCKYLTQNVRANALTEIEILPKVKEVLRAEADAINAVKIDSSYEEAINILFESSGKIITTGMGKAGFVAQKFAAIMSSTGTSSVFIHPAEAAHGDLGVISKNDSIGSNLLLSNKRILRQAARLYS